MRHTVGAHKVRQNLIIVIHQLFKSNCIYLDSEMTVKIQQFQLSKKQSNIYCKKVL